MLDVEHADITASLVGCNAQEHDRVLINGESEDGVDWTLFGVTRQHRTPVHPVLEDPSIPPGKFELALPEVRFRLKPAYYSALAITVGDCVFNPIPLVADGNRRITLTRQSQPTQQAALTDLAGVYGYLPYPTLRVTLTGGSPEVTLIAKNETVAYYFDAVKPGIYTLAVSCTRWSRTLGTVNVVSGQLVMWYIHESDMPPPYDNAGSGSTDEDRMGDPRCAF